MRNLKRVLSLALALVMVLGMMVIGTSAATFTDAEQITETEAVEVMAALGILKGDNGAFNPKGNLNRAGAAKLIAFMTMGAEADNYLSGSVATFSDVPADHWAAKYIAYCANLKIINGNGDDTFNPNGNISTVGFAKLVLGAAGVAGTYTGAGWEQNVKAAAKDAGLDVITIDNTDITREEAAALMLAGMKYSATPDSYNVIDTKGTDATTDDKVVAKFDKLLDAVLYAEVLGANYTYAQAPATDTLLKEVYGVTYTPETVDAYGRPAVSYDNGKTGAQKVELLFVDEADYTVNVTSVLNNELAEIAEALDLDVATGVSMADAAKGDTVELFLNADGDIATAVKLHTELGQIVKVVKTKDEDAKYTYDVTIKIGGSNSVYTDVELEGFDVETMVKDTYITIVENADTDYAVVALADSITGKQTAKGTGYTKIDGVQTYYAGDVWAIDDVNYTDTFNFFVDAKGLIIGTEKAAAAKVATNIFYVADKKFVAGDDFTAKKAQLSVINLDGTSEILDMVITKGKVKIGATDYALSAAAAQVTAGFYAYTVDADGNVMSIKAVGTTGLATSGVLNTKELLADDNYVTIAAKDAEVNVNGTTMYATTETKVVVIDPSEEEAVTLTGYNKFVDATYEVNTEEEDTDETGNDLATAILYVYDKDVLKTVYVLGSTVSVTDDAVKGWLVEAGDEFELATVPGVVFQYVVYNVKGEDVTYLAIQNSYVEEIEGVDTVVYPEFAEIEVTDGVAALTDASTEKTNKAVTKVTDTYMVVDGTTYYFASDVAYYDVTNVAKYGVVADDAVVVGDIVTFTTKLVAGAEVVDAVYTTFAAQENGGIIIDWENPADMSYWTNVLGLNPEYFDSFSDECYGVFQWTRPATGTYDEIILEYWDPEVPATVYEWDITNYSWNGVTAGTNGMVFAGDDEVPVIGYRIVVDGVVTETGSFEMVAK